MINCLIVEDEPLAAELLKSYIEKVPDLALAAHCDSAVDAFAVLQRLPIELMFLDIRLPRLTGLELLKTLRQPPPVILTTAYRDYAAESYDYDVLDYLVKPIQFDRFLKSVGKYYQRQTAQVAVPPPAGTHSNRPICSFAWTGNSKKYGSATSFISKGWVTMSRCSPRPDRW